MVHFELLRDRNILIVTPEGPLEKEDFEKHAKVVGPFLESKWKVGRPYDLPKSFPGWESFRALISHLNFVTDHHRRTERIC